MEKPWLQHYPQGIPAEIALDEFASLADMLARSVAQFADKPAYTNFATRLSYADVDRLSGAVAAYLQHELKLQRGDRVAIMMPNLLQYPVAMFGVLRAGLVVVNVNPLYTARELKHQLCDAGVRAIVIVENFAATLSRIIANTPVESVIVTRVGDLLRPHKRVAINLVLKYVKKAVPRFDLPDAIGFAEVLRHGAERPVPQPDLGHQDVAFLQYTGGTTGRAKGATLTHGNMLANVQQASAWLAPWMKPGGETIITALPLYHIFACTANCLVFTKIGGFNVLITNPRDLPGFVRELRRHRFTAITGVNTLFNGLLHTPGFAELDFSALKFALGGGMAVQRAVAEKWHQVTGKPIIEAYGLTETAPAACINPLDQDQYNGAIGLPLPATDCCIVNDQGKRLPTGDIGELGIRGPQVMRGYWEQPQATRAAFTESGFLRTGDIARMDERGYFYIVDRKKDMILVSGFNVYPNEIEAVVAEHPKVLEAACTGVTDEKSGEAVKLFVVKQDATLDEAELIAFCRENLTAYKVPRQVAFRDQLPKSNVGKILRKDLR